MDKKTVLSLEIGDYKAEVLFNHEDVTLNELFCAFRGILVAHTFTESQVINYIKDFADDYKD